MPAATLGDFDFSVYKGPPYHLERAHLITETRPGYDGFDVWNIGSWGDKFEVNTIAVYDTYDNAVAAVADYDDSVADTGLDLEVNGVAVAGYTFKVFSVEAKARKVIKAITADDGTEYGAIVEAKWTLAAIED